MSSNNIKTLKLKERSSSNSTLFINSPVRNQFNRHSDFELHNETIQDIYTHDGFKSNRILYLDNGGNEGSGCKFTAEDAKEDEDYRDNYCYTRAFVDKMAEIGYTFDVNLFHWFELNAAHNEDAWAARVSRPLMIFMEKI